MEKHVPVADLAKKLSCSRETVRRMLRAGEISGLKVGKDWRVDPAAAILALSQGATPAKSNPVAGETK